VFKSYRFVYVTVPSINIYDVRIKFTDEILTQNYHMSTCTHHSPETYWERGLTFQQLYVLLTLY
jgi:hypothetical protein